MNRSTILFITLILSLSGFSQEQLFVLHPVVGDTINQTEKMDYLLFPDIDHSDFKYGYIAQLTDGYFIHSFTWNDSVITRQLDPTEMKQYRDNIDKLSAYFSNKAKQDSVKNAQKLTLDLNSTSPQQFNGKIVGTDDEERIMDQVRQTNRLKDDAERHKHVMEGNDIFGDQMRIEFLRIKRKKRK